MGKIAADSRADGRRKCRDKPDDRRDDGALRRREDGEGRSEYRRNHPPADKALDRAVDDHLIDIRRRGAERTGNRETGSRSSEEIAGRYDACERA
ncbi:hypothetical protein D3C80_196460 [compost metagenome]